MVPKKQATEAASTETASTAAVRQKLTHKVIEYGSYLIKARKLYGDDNALNNALSLLYSENDVVAKIEIKGIPKFIVKI